MPTYRSCLAFLGLTFVNLGCNSTPPGTPAATVHGTVHMDGKAIPIGEIHFSMPGVPPMVLKIADGHFAGDAPVGKNQVEVFIHVEGPPSEKYAGTPTMINTAPERYWGPNTVLEATVTAGAANEFKFDLFVSP